MGYGDELMATGLAKGARARGKRIAFGDPATNQFGQIRWSHLSEEIFRGNPNIAPPGSEGATDLEWVRFHKGHRIYNSMDASPYSKRWIWNRQFKAVPGELYFTDQELEFGRSFGKDYILIEPNVPAHKAVARNKQWPMERFIRLCDTLVQQGYDVRQMVYNAPHTLPRAKHIRTPTFRHAMSVLKNARMIVTGEGGLHHGAAAVGIRAVVIFGSFIPPEITGYDSHVNIAFGEPCGRCEPCDHCRHAMQSISFERVLEETVKMVNEQQERVA